MTCEQSPHPGRQGARDGQNYNFLFAHVIKHNFKRNVDRLLSFAPDI
jgi:hypothetical protein